jgi:hypothetical protein
MYTFFNVPDGHLSDYCPSLEVSIGFAAQIEMQQDSKSKNMCQKKSTSEFHFGNRVLVDPVTSRRILRVPSME